LCKIVNFVESTTVEFLCALQFWFTLFPISSIHLRSRIRANVPEKYDLYCIGPRRDTAHDCDSAILDSRSSSIEGTLSQRMAYKRRSIIRIRVTMLRGGIPTAEDCERLQDLLSTKIRCEASGELAPLWSLPVPEKKPKERLGNIEVTRVCMGIQCVPRLRVCCVYHVLARYCHSRVVRARTNAKGAYAKGRRFLWYPDISPKEQPGISKITQSHF